MAMRSAIRKLSKTDLSELHQRLRDTWYSDVDDHTAWLKGKGYDISRSSLHRYMLRLRETDKESGSEQAAIAASRADSKQRKRQLLERLGALRVEELRILEQLVALEEAGTIPLSPAANG